MNVQTVANSKQSDTDPDELKVSACPVNEHASSDTHECFADGDGQDKDAGA